MTPSHLKMVYICAEMLGLSNEPKFSLIGPCVPMLRAFEYHNLWFLGRDKIGQNSPKGAYISKTNRIRWLGGVLK